MVGNEMSVGFRSNVVSAKLSHGGDDEKILKWIMKADRMNWILIEFGINETVTVVTMKEAWR